jgi:hypothetical protein
VEGLKKVCDIGSLLYLGIVTITALCGKFKAMLYAAGA